MYHHINCIQNIEKVFDCRAHKVYRQQDRCHQETGARMKKETPS